MTIFNRTDILANRQKWIDFLMRPDTKKGRTRLDNGNGKRCCLGHACHVFGLEPGHDRSSDNPFITYENQALFAPESIVERLGLWNRVGGNSIKHENVPLFGLPKEMGGYAQARICLADVNDDTEATPQEIGAYLLTVIEGGPETPFRPLSDYLE